MKYFETVVSLCVESSLLSDAKDVMCNLLGDAGYESFSADEGPEVHAYVQQKDYDESLLTTAIGTFCGLFGDGAAQVVSHGEAEQQDWNAAWEAEGFEPIEVGPLRVCPYTAGAAATNMEILIDARMAFGTGTHHTTQMMLGLLSAEDLSGLSVLDCGTGTGILAIAACKLGASYVMGYDIDEWSTDNACHNAAINSVTIDVRQGDSSVLSDQSMKFDVVMANIHRNIILADLHCFTEHLAAGGRLLLSGFYVSDQTAISEAAVQLGLAPGRQLTSDEWTAMEFRKDK